MLAACRSRELLYGCHGARFSLRLLLAAALMFLPPMVLDAGDDSSNHRAAVMIRRLPPTHATSSTAQDDAETEFHILPVSAWGGYNDSRADSVAGTHTSLYVGYDNGFVIAAGEGDGHDAESLDFLMRINSWFQLRHKVFDSDGPNPDENTLSFERLRLSFGGHVFSPDLKFFFQLDGNSDNSTSVSFLDYYTTYDLGHDMLCWDGHHRGRDPGVQREIALRRGVDGDVLN